MTCVLNCSWLVPSGVGAVYIKQHARSKLCFPTFTYFSCVFVCLHKWGIHFSKGLSNRRLDKSLLGMEMRRSSGVRSWVKMKLLNECAGLQDRPLCHESKYESKKKKRTAERFSSEIHENGKTSFAQRGESRNQKQSSLRLPFLHSFFLFLYSKNKHE